MTSPPLARSRWLGFPRRGTAVALLALPLAGVGCGASAPTLRLRVADGQLSSPAVWRDTLQRQALPRHGARKTEAALAVGASAGELMAARLDRAQTDARLWRVPLATLSAPALAPGVVASSVGNEVRLLDARDGRALRALPMRDPLLLGVAVDAAASALLVGDRRGERAVSVYDGASRERLRVSAEGGVGAPALLGGTLLVPWGEGYLSVVDVDDATELSRVRVGPVPQHALWNAGTLFFGGPPWVELDAIGTAPPELPRRPLPGPFESGPVTLGARAPEATSPAPEVQPTHLYVLPEPASANAGTAPGTVYMATHGRVAFGLEREQGALAWVVALPGQVLAAAPVANGFLVCDDSGGVRLLDAESGRLLRQWTLTRQRRMLLGEKALTGCALASGKVLGPEATAKPAPAEPPLLEQLARVLDMNDAGLTEAQRFLARELAARPEPEATRVLIELVTRHSLDRLLQSEAEDLLATRRNGQDFMLEALAQTGSAGADATALPPIAPLGEALAALHDERAAPLLARQLNRPAHEAQAVARAAAALEELASEAEYAELSVFFSLHRTTADGPEWVAAVVSIAHTLQRIGGQKARTLLGFARKDPLTVSEVRAALNLELGPAPANAPALQSVVPAVAPTP